MPSDPYAAGLSLLARRERSTAELTAALRKRGFDPDAIAGAVDRLRREEALDDHRAALVHARHRARISHRGPLRAEREIAALGIDPAIVRAAVAEVYAAEGVGNLIERALERRLPAGSAITDRAHFGRLYRHLVRQGFDPQLAAATLRARGAPSTPDPEDDPAS